MSYPIVISNIHHSMTGKQLQKLAQKIEPGANSRLITSAEGKSKGFGFIYFHLEESRTIALKKLADHTVYNRKFKVEILKPNN